MNNHKIKQLKAQFRKAKRRIELGVAKPNDMEIISKLSRELGYE